jgi:hypothetical protein
VFEFVEEPLNQIALFVEFRVEVMRPQASRPGWDDRLGTQIKDRIVEMLSVVSAVGNDKAAGDAVDQRGAIQDLAAMPGACNQARRIAQGVGGDVQLGAQAAS